MITNGFVPSYSDAVTIGSPFTSNNQTFVSAYICVGTGGDIVWQNAQGQPQWLPGALAGQVYILGATKILASGTVNGVSRTTTASNMVWLAVNQVYNTP